MNFAENLLWLLHANSITTYINFNVFDGLASSYVFWLPINTGPSVSVKGTLFASKFSRGSQSSDSNRLEEAWNIEYSAVIPEKSKERYEHTFKLFQDWCNEEKYANITDKVLFAYFTRRNEKLKSPGSS